MDTIYLLEKLDNFLEKLEMVFGGKNNLTYLTIYGLKVDQLGAKCLENPSAIRKLDMKNSFVKQEPESIEHLARLDRVVGSGPNFMKAPTQLLIALAKLSKGDIQ